jgi:hypothetical protein
LPVASRYGEPCPEADIGFTGGNGTHQVYINGLTDHRLKNADIRRPPRRAGREEGRRDRSREERERESSLAAGQ